jgi:uncharacterized membrane-anchored protein
MAVVVFSLFIFKIITTMPFLCFMGFVLFFGFVQIVIEKAVEQNLGISKFWVTTVLCGFYLFMIWYNITNHTSKNDRHGWGLLALIFVFVILILVAIIATLIHWWLEQRNPKQKNIDDERIIDNNLY